MRTLIFGARGFVGTHLTQHLRSVKGWDVISCDLAPATESNHYTFDLSRPGSLDVLFSQKQFDVCINCSGAADVPMSLREPARDFTMNVANVHRILDFLRLHSPAVKVIHLSSAAVYGQPQQLPVPESHPTVPISAYGWHKLMSEAICREFNQVYQLPTCSLRVFSAFGPGLRKQLFWDLAQRTSQSQAVELFGTGRESRDFIFVEDLSSAIALVAEHAEFRGEAINVANGEEVSVEHAARTFLNAGKWQNTLSFSGQVRKGDPLNWCADITLLKSYGYKPQVSFEAGVERYVKWLREHV